MAFVNDWKICRIGDEIEALEAGVSVNSDANNNGSGYFILKTSAVSKGKVDLREVKSVIPKDISRLKCSLKANSILISRMNTPDLVGECGYVEKDNDSVFLPDRIWQTVLKKGSELNCKWLTYVLNTENLRKYLKNAATGTSNSMKNISKDQVLSIEMQFPKSEEQCAIAKALADTDALLAAMEILIAKKRAIKQGAMQELLTGIRRLPGFEGEWKVKSFGDICEISSSLVDPRLDEYRRLPHIGNESIEKATGKLLSYRSAQEDGLISGKYLFSDNDVLYGKINPQFAKACFPLFSGLCSADMYPLSTKPGFSPRFLLYIILSEHFTNYTISVSMRSGMPKVNRDELYAYECHMPVLAEQTAIAEILSDMDAEIDALTAKLNKLRSIKKGMMYELLTGHIRLIEEKAYAETYASTKVVESPKPKVETESDTVIYMAATHKGGHNQQFDDAVMIAGIVNVLYSDMFPLGRKKVQKCLYLLRRHQDESTKAFKKKAAGPYADEVRYKGGEPIALSSHYIETTTVKDKGTTFARGKNISKALDYIQSWGKQEDMKWVSDKLKYKNVDELELLSTVDMAICDLTEVGTPVSLGSIKHLIATNEEWKDKLKKQSFNDASIARAIRDLQTLL